MGVRYAMRAVYLARGSELLPPGFASLFDDSAASALDVFFDPSNGSINAQNLTRGEGGIRASRAQITIFCIIMWTDYP